MADVLFESRLADGRWIGHAANYVPVAVAGSGSAAGSASGEESLANSIGRVAVEGVDRFARDRAIGRVVAVSPPRARGLSLPFVLTGGADGR
jgi:hypothetical protein